MIFWTKELCRIEALKYSTKKEFRANNGSAHNFAYNHNYLDEICKHMVKLGNKFNRCVYAYEFSDKSVYVGITSNFKRRKADRERKPNDTVTQYINKTGFQYVHKQLTDYINVDIASELEGEYLNKYKAEGWKILNIAKTGGIGGGILIWTKEKCLVEGLKFTMRSDFNLKSKGAYDSARRNGWLPEIYARMKPVDRSKLNLVWTKEKCREEALKYNKITDFDNNSRGAYFSARKNGWLDEISRHMKRKM